MQSITHTINTHSLTYIQKHSHGFIFVYIYIHTSTLHIYPKSVRGDDSCVKQAVLMRVAELLPVPWEQSLRHCEGSRASTTLHYCFSYPIRYLYNMQSIYYVQGTIVVGCLHLLSSLHTIARIWTLQMFQSMLKIYTWMNKVHWTLKRQNKSNCFFKLYINCK